MQTYHTEKAVPATEAGIASTRAAANFMVLVVVGGAGAKKFGEQKQKNRESLPSGKRHVRACERFVLSFPKTAGKKKQRGSQFYIHAEENTPASALLL